MSRSLDGLRVIELARNVAGPYAGKHLADQGADVVKVEPINGDPSRLFGPFPEGNRHPERSGLFLHLNRGKRSMVVDALTEEGGSIIRELVTDADVLIEDCSPGEPAQWGWGWDELSAINPSLVMTSITPYGQTGPYRHFRGSELTLQALGGPLYTNGHESRYPLKLAGHFAHYHAGLMATVATLMALRRAEGSGHGDWIDLAVYECQAACRDRQCVYLTIAGYSGMSVGRQRSAAARMGAGVRRCNDGYVNIMGAANRLPRLLELIGRGDLANTPGLRNPAGTVPKELFDELEGAYSEWLARRDKADVVEMARDSGLIAGPVNTIENVMADPHFSARNIWEDIEHPETGKLRYPGRPFVMGASPTMPPRRAPLLGEHSEALQPRGSTTAPRTRADRDVRFAELPMANLRVAEITVVWAGPHVTQLLGDWGADVIRVEPVNKPQPYTRGMEDVPSDAQAQALSAQGIPTRLAGNSPGNDPWNRNAAFNSHARNKRGMTCDIMSEQGRGDLLRLLSTCDILVENNVPSTMDKARITWKELHALNPRLIWLRMPAFALEGPHRNLRAFGLHVEAMVGHTHLRGYPGESPELLSESLASDGVAGVQGAVALLMALRHRERTGEGQLIEMPLTEGFLPTFGEFILAHSMNGEDTPTQGNRHPWHAPHNVYPCAGDDHWIAVDVATDGEFVALLATLGADVLATDRRFSSAAARQQHRDALDQELTALTVSRDKEELFIALQRAGVCAAPVRKATEVLADEHLNARGLFQTLPTGDAGTPYPYPGLSFRMLRTPNRLRTGPVRLGEHNAELYQGLLGYTDEAYAELVASGVVSDVFPPSVWRPEKGG